MQAIENRALGSRGRHRAIPTPHTPARVWAGPVAPAWSRLFFSRFVLLFPVFLFFLFQFSFIVFSFTFF
jgi:hypothetical protein